MILSSKQAVLLSANENKQFFMFDPKTTAVLHKYRTQEPIEPHHVYHQHSQQILAQQVGKTFMSVWNWEAQEVELKMSMTQTLSSLSFSQDGHFLFGGSITGNAYLWEVPSGLLLKKKPLHSSGIIKILPYKDNHILSVSKTQLKIWPLSSLLIEEDNSPPLKLHTTVLDIISVGHARNIIAVLTHKSLTLLNGGLTSKQRELQVHQKIDYEFATALAVSNTTVFVGDGKGSIQLVDLVPSEEDRVHLHFRAQNDQLEITHSKKKRVLNGSKHPVTCLVFVDTLAYLISGHSNGELFIWSNHQIKKSLFLFKTAITGATLLPKPRELKVYQQDKLKPLNKYEQGKEQELLEIIPCSSRAGKELSFELQIERNNDDEEVLDRMMTTLRQPEKLLREEVGCLRQERKKLMQANEHYFKMLVP